MMYDTVQYHSIRHNTIIVNVSYTDKIKHTALQCISTMRIIPYVPEIPPVSPNTAPKVSPEERPTDLRSSTSARIPKTV
jgi:hypothetical protein